MEKKSVNIFLRNNWNKIKVIKAITITGHMLDDKLLKFIHALCILYNANISFYIANILKNLYYVHANI